MIQEITVTEKNVLVSLSGSIYVEEAAQIRESLIGYIDNGHKTFIVDLGNVDYIDSSGSGNVGGHSETGPAKWRQCESSKA